MFFLNQEINPATTSNPESKSMNIKEYEHQTYRKKKNMNITKSKSINKSIHRKNHTKPYPNQTIQRIENQQNTQLIHSQTKP